LAHSYRKTSPTPDEGLETNDNHMDNQYESIERPFENLADEGEFDLSLFSL